MTENNEKVVRFLEVLVDKIFQQLIRGQYDCEIDLKALEKYLEQARNLDARMLEARILNNIAILNNVSGRSDLCEEYLWKAYEIYEAEDNRERIGATLGNLATLNTTRGDYETSLELFNRALNFEGNDNIHFLLSGKMNILLVLDRYDEVIECFNLIQSESQNTLSNENKANFARFMSSVYRTMAETHLQQQDFETANQYIIMARNFGEGLNLTFGLSEIYYTLAHIALIQNDDHEGANQHWEEADKILEGINSPSHLGRGYLQEARYLQRAGYPEKSQDFAQRAVAIFESHDMQDDLELAQQLLI